ncbi:tumor necrosis factor-like [Latimeria chalumnae]|uniref:tumor necrosis factor-like n=1 Tax=Latimeria chalumnae TaxID=7897 RepID=UPI00313C734B
MVAAGQGEGEERDSRIVSSSKNSRVAARQGEEEQVSTAAVRMAALTGTSGQTGRTREAAVVVDGHCRSFPPGHTELLKRADVPSAHLTAVYQDSPTTILQWYQEDGSMSKSYFRNGMDLETNSESLVMPKDGYYYIYMQVAIRENCTSHSSLKLIAKSNKRETSLLRKDFSSICHVIGHQSSGYIGGQYLLSKDDEVKVSIEPPRKVIDDQQETFFGIFMVEERI